MAEMTFSSIHWAEPDGTGPMIPIRFRVMDESKMTPEFEKQGDAIIAMGDTFETAKIYHSFLLTATKEEVLEFHADTGVVDLHQEGIIVIDLTQLVTFPNLQVLVMGYNALFFEDFAPLAKCVLLEELLLDKCYLQEIDLSFANSCPNLRLITLRNTPIHQIDLTPLQNCPKFEVLNMEGNQLERIDLSPLSACKHLTFLGLQRNFLVDLNLTPLASCKDLGVLYLHENEYETLDVRPLASCRKLEDCRVDAVNIIKVPEGQENVCELGKATHRGEEVVEKCEEEERDNIPSTTSPRSDDPSEAVRKVDEDDDADDGGLDKTPK